MAGVDSHSIGRQMFEQRNIGNGSPEISRKEIESAISKAVELRALHAALVQAKTSPSNPPTRFPSPAQNSRSVSAQDYPLFTPVSFLLSSFTCYT